jgi:PAS domain-containing protein
MFYRLVDKETQMTLCLEQPELVTDDFAQDLFGTTPKQPGTTFFYGLELNQNRLFHFSSAVREAVGYSSTEAMRNGLKWFVEQIHPEDLQHLNHLADRHPQSPILHDIRYRFKTKTGVFCPLVESRCLLHDSNGHPSVLIGRIEKV